LKPGSGAAEVADQLPEPEDVAGRLCRTPVFKSAPAGAVLDLVRAGVIRRLGRREFLFLEAERPGGIYFIVDGQVKVVRQGADGSETILHLVGAGEFVGLVAALADRPLPASAQAIGPTVVLWLPGDRFRAFLLRYPEVALAVMGLMAGRLHEIQNRFHDVSTARVEGRLARLLLHLAGRAGRRTPEGVVLLLPLTRAELAELCGTRLYTVSRVLNEWQRAGAIRLARRRVVILRPDLLAEIAGEVEPAGWVIA